MSKLSAKQEKEAVKEKKKVKAAIDKGNLEVARIHGENSERPTPCPPPPRTSLCCSRV